MEITRTKPYIIIVSKKDKVYIQEYDTEKEMDLEIENIAVSYGEEGKTHPIVYSGL